MIFKITLKQLVWNILNPALLKWKKQNCYSWDVKYAGLNLGCGIDNPENWLGVDGGITHVLAKQIPKPFFKAFFKFFKMAKNYTYSEFYKKIKSIAFIHHDLRFGIPFHNNSIPNIYSSHFIEHLTRNESGKLISECFRVLRSGGVIRICVPSLEKEIAVMEDAIAKAKAGEVMPIQKYVTAEHDGFSSNYSYHRFMFNAQELAKLLNEAGFSDIKQREFKKGEIPDVEHLDTRDGIYFEAKKTV